jgi:sugar phosphate isomerase/epimerase
MNVPATLLAIAVAGLLPTVHMASGQTATKPGDFTIAGHAWTYNQGTVFEALEKTKAAGGTALEVYLMGQKLSTDLPGIELSESLSDEHLALLKAKMKETGVQILNAYIGSKQWTRIEQSEPDLRKFFEFGRKLGIKGFTGEPAERQWDMIEKLLKEFDLTFSIHNHIRGFEAPYIGPEYKYWDPSYTFKRLEEQKRDRRFGICLDTGHVARSELNPLAVLKTVGSRVNSLHLKDVVAAHPDGHDCVYGTGIVDVRGILGELQRTRFNGHIAIEYEWFRSPTFAEDIGKCVAYVHSFQGVQ